jgi:Zn-dependent peptidase ImmA (M78 family)/DNA-binding XRE family transcriptional regulator
MLNLLTYCNKQISNIFLRKPICKTTIGTLDYKETMAERHDFIGLRVKTARESARLTQEGLASKLGFKDRQTVSDIETGKRALQSNELLLLAEATDRDIEFFIDPFAVAGEAQFAWRADPAISDDALARFEAKAGQWIGLLKWLREQNGSRASALRHRLRLGMRSSFADAEARAEELVRELDLGDFPAGRLLEVIEQKLDIPVLFVDAVRTDGDKPVSGSACHLEELCVILINRNESEARRHYNLAHELFHALTWETLKPEHREMPVQSNTARRVERLADNFAAALLMPRASIEKHFDNGRATDIGHLSALASLFKVSPEALSWRLLNLKLISSETQKRLSQRHSLAGTQPEAFSQTFVLMLHDALAKGRLSLRKAAKVVGIEANSLLEVFRRYGLSSPLDA